MWGAEKQIIISTQNYSKSLYLLKLKRTTKFDVREVIIQ